MINFNEPTLVGKELDYIKDAVTVEHKLCGDGKYTRLCNKWIEDNTGVSKAMLTTSCTHAIEIAALLCDIHEGDEVIMPSYTFCSTADAFVLRGARIVFVDIRPDTMNINEDLIENAITEKTKVIVPVHYAGVGCEMDKIMSIASRYGLKVVEDAAQGVKASYKGSALGSIGDFGCFSFHETKNYCMGEGGAILLRDPDMIEKAEIIREKGTNRSKFFRGQVDKYTWVDKGSSYLPSELNAAYLWAQLEVAEEILDDRLKKWNMYWDILSSNDMLKSMIELPYIPDYCKHNAHMFYIKVRDLDERTKLIAYLRERDINSVFHYVPLHSAEAGLKYGRFHGDDVYTTRESERLLRLPLHYGLSESNIRYICDTIIKYVKENC